MISPGMRRPSPAPRSGRLERCPSNRSRQDGACYLCYYCLITLPIRDGVGRGVGGVGAECLEKEGYGKRGEGGFG